MNQKQYLDALKKALKGTDSQNRENILLEIKGLISELSINESIEERFGSPIELAQQYLKDEPIKPTVGKKAMSIGKKIFLTIGVGITLLVLGLALSAWYFSKDSFNYADMTAEQLDIKGKNWKSVEWNSDIELELDQGRAIIYWHDQPQIKWNCGEEQDLNPVANKALKIRHEQCLLFLPKQAVKIQAKQSDVVMIKPQVMINVVLNQSKLRIAESDEKYKLEIDATRSKIGNFVSHDDAQMTLRIKSEESTVEVYQY